MPSIKNDAKRNQLSEGQSCYFLIGHTWEFMDHPEFPFVSQGEREVVWAKYRKHLIAKCHEPRVLKGFCDPGRNQLRPDEWWLVDAPEPRRVLNGAIELDKNGTYDKEPVFESDGEFLARLNLLTSEDRAYMQTDCFKEAEKFDIDYRTYSDMNFPALMEDNPLS